MKHMARVAAVVVLALALCQSAMAAPTQGAFMATSNSNNLGLFDRFLQIFGAIWGGAPGNHAAIWGGGTGDHGAIWGTPNNSSVVSPSSGSKGTTTEGAIWGCQSKC